MRLEDIQNDFVAAIFGNNPETAASHVIGDDKLTAEQRFGIYRGSVHGILTKTIGLTFPVCKSLLGQDFFDRMCDRFIDQHPPTTSFFAEYGSQFPSFLSTFEPVRELPYLHDVAVLEWARQIVWHQQHEQASDFSELANLTDEQQTRLLFELKSTMQLIQSDYRVDQLWFAHQQDSDLQLEDIKLNEAVKFILWKGHEGIKITLMNQNEKDSLQWDFLHTLSKEVTINEIAEKFGELLPEFLSMSIQEGWIQSFKII